MMFTLEALAIYIVFLLVSLVLLRLVYHKSKQESKSDI